MASTMSKMNKKRMWYVIGLFIQLVVPMFCPSWGGITEMGIKMFWTFIGVMVLFMGTNDIAGSCLVTGIVTVIHGYATLDTIYMKLLGNSMTMQMIMMLAYSFVLRDTGVMITFGRWLVSKCRVFQKMPTIFNILLMVVMLICNLFIGGTVMVFTILPLFEGIAAAMGYNINDKWHKIMVSGIFMTSVCAQYSRGTDGMTVNWINIWTTAVEAAGVTYNHSTFQFMIASRAGLLLFVVAYVLVAKFLFRCDMSKLKELDMDKVEELKPENIHFTWNQLLMFGLFLIVVLRGYISAPFETGSEAARIYAAFPITVVCMVALVLTSLIQYKGEPITNLNKCFAGMPWGIVFSLGLMGTVAGALADNDLGIRAWMLSVLSPIYGGHSFPIFVFMILLTTCFITNLMSNQATIIMMLSIAATFLPQYSGLNFVPLCGSICMVGNIAQMTYSSGPVSALYLDRPEFKNDRKFVYTIGLSMMLLSTVCFTITTCIFCSAMA